MVGKVSAFFCTPLPHLLESDMRPFIKCFQEPSSHWALRAPVPLGLWGRPALLLPLLGEEAEILRDFDTLATASGQSHKVALSLTCLAVTLSCLCVSFVPDSICARALYTSWGTGLTSKDKSRPFSEIVARRRRRCDVTGNGIIGTLEVGMTDKFDQISNKCWVQ